MIHRQLSQLFPEIHIPQPIEIIPYYWEVGTHVWKPGVNSSHIYKKVLNPVENVYVCGEAYSMRQEWMEGALLMAKDVIDRIHA
jgi:monoamine oxidase